MTVKVVAEGEEEEPVVTAGPQSPLALLRGKRDELVAGLHLDLAVPRWDDVLEGRQLWVRYRPANPNVFAEAMERREKKHKEAKAKGTVGDPDWMTKANADLLVSACEAVYDLPDGEEPPDTLEGDYPTFTSEELSEALGASRNACDTVLKLYATGADVLLAATQLLNWSGQASKEADRSFLTT